MENEEKPGWKERKEEDSEEKSENGGGGGEKAAAAQPGSDYIITVEDLKPGLRSKKKKLQLHRNLQISQ